MKYNRDLEYIKNEFEKDNITAPESLGEDALAERLDGADKNESIIKIPTRSKRSVKRLIAAAACIVLLITALPVGMAVNSRLSTPPVAAESGLVYFKSYNEIDKLISANAKKESGNVLRNGIEYAKSFVVNEKSAAVADGVAESAVAGNTASHAETYKQVDAVDEADIIKTDGKYIYFLGADYGNELVIYSAKDGKTKKLASVKSKNDYESFSEMYLDGDSLILLGTKSVESSKERYSFRQYAFCRVYDITDRSAPKLKNEYKQSGSYSTSRFIDGYIYLISNYNNYYYPPYYRGAPVDYVDGEIEDDAEDDGEDGEAEVTEAAETEADDSKYPKCGNGKAETIPVENICGTETANSESYCVIGAVNAKTGEGESKKAKALLTSSDNVYMNEKHLYVTSRLYHYKEGYSLRFETETQIAKYSFSGDKITLEASVKVEGGTDSQYSLDEKDGNLRIATTSSSSGGKDTNNLFVLDKKLNEIGRVTGFAKNEHIEAVRFLGDTAYVITYEQIDPLFIIDLSNPKSPKIKGEVEIEGFSTSLTPIDENTLLGIGFGTEDNGYGGERSDGVKVVLFDISNKNKPRVLDSKAFSGTDSDAQYNPKAIVVNRDKGYFAIPLNAYDDYDYDDDGNETVIKSKYASGALVIRAEDGELDTENIDAELDSDEFCSRCTYIGDYLYILTTEGITSHEVK